MGLISQAWTSLAPPGAINARLVGVYYQVARQTGLI
jgi:hypothetical protein